MSEEARYRTERDSLGEKRVPIDAYWGIHSLRARENFHLSGTPISALPELIRAYAQVKWAAAQANRDMGVLAGDKADLIARACQEIAQGGLRDQFIVDVIQGGAGTSTNMNVNEVIANRALELGGHAKGDYRYIHPIDDVNRSQSTNDTYPTAIRIALIASLGTALEEFGGLRQSFAQRADAFRGIVKIGRTQLQDALPMTLGQEFQGFEAVLSAEHEALNRVLWQLSEINLGGTAIGTGLNAPAGYAEAAREHLCRATGLQLRTADDLVAASADTGAFVALSGALKQTAIKVSKICNDLRLLSSGPQAGLSEITLPARQAGSSIMPAKVNPVIPEAMNQIAFWVMGADLTVSMAAEHGQLQLNAFEPLMASSLLQAIGMLRCGFRTLRVNCVEGIRANEIVLNSRIKTSVTVVTALTPFIGYSEATRLAKEALEEHRDISELVVEHGLMSRSQVERILGSELLASLHCGEQPVAGCQ